MARHHEIDLQGDVELRGFLYEDDPPLTEAEQRQRAAEMAAIEAVVPDVLLHPPDREHEALMALLDEEDPDGAAEPIVFEEQAATVARMAADLAGPVEATCTEPIDEDGEEPARPRRPVDAPEADPDVPDPVDDPAAPGDDE